MNRYEDNLFDLDDENEFKTVIPLIRVSPNKTNNLDEIFEMVLRRPVTGDDVSFTKAELDKLERLGVALEW